MQGGLLDIHACDCAQKPGRVCCLGWCSQCSIQVCVVGLQAIQSDSVVDGKKGMSGVVVMNGAVLSLKAPAMGVGACRTACSHMLAAAICWAC